MSVTQTNDAFLDAFFAEPNLSWPGRLSTHASASYLRRFLGALDDPGDAPLVLPRRDAGWPAASAYVMCWSPSHAARIRALLGAAVAQNWCEFDGRLARLTDDPIDAAVIGRFGANTTYILRPATPSAQQGIFTALSQLVSSLERRPLRESRVARPVGRLLRDFDTSLAAGQAATSLDLLEQIERTGGISHENIAFLRIRRLGQLGEDHQILSDGALRTVVATEPPRLVREAILAAWYRVNARDASSPVESIERLRDFHVDIALLVDDASVASASADAWATAALVALAREDITIARGLLISEPEGPGELRDLLESMVREDVHSSPLPETHTAAPWVNEPASQATRDSTDLGIAEYSGEPRAAAESPGQASANDAGPEAEVGAAGEPGPQADSWLAWIDSLRHEDSPVLDVEIAEGWPAPGDVDASLADAIEKLPDAMTGRMFTGLAAFIDCDVIARPAWKTSAVLIRRQLLSDSLNPSDLGAMSALLAIFLRGGPDVRAYRGLLDDLVDHDLKGRWATVSTASVAMDIADLVVTSSTADRAAQQGFVAAALEALHAQRHRLPEALRIIGDLATSDCALPWDWSVEQSAEVDAQPDSARMPASILLYSLEEAVLARAKTAVERLYPGIQIAISSAKVGGVSLRPTCQGWVSPPVHSKSAL